MIKFMAAETASGCKLTCSMTGLTKYTDIKSEGEPSSSSDFKNC